MVDVMERGNEAATRPGQPQQSRREADARWRSALGERAVRRAGQASWAPTLAGSDLACLLQVIEAELLPRLLGEYRPADHAPLKAAPPG